MGKGREYIEKIRVSGDGSAVSLDTTNFDTNLSATDDTVQKAMETLDDVAGGGGGPLIVRNLSQGIINDIPDSFLSTFAFFITGMVTFDGHFASTADGWIYIKLYEDNPLIGRPFNIPLWLLNGITTDMSVTFNWFAGSDISFSVDDPSGILLGGGYQIFQVQSP